MLFYWAVNRLLLVDSHNLLFKAFYGVPERLLADGTPIHGFLGFIGMLKKIIGHVEPSHLLVVFDPEGAHSRRQLCPQYKANRHDYSGMPDRENPFSQLGRITHALDRLGVRWLEETGCEADDVIASYAVQAACQTVIASSDADFLQLVDARISVFRYGGRNSVLFDEGEVVRRYGIHPSKFLEYKALTGDKSDRIAGLEGVGPKTAARILNGERALSPDESRLFEANRDLMRLNTEMQLPIGLEQLSLDEAVLRTKIGSLLS
jgi:DNA polymerase-1